MACCLPFTVSVRAGGVGFTQLADPRGGRIRNQHAPSSTAGGQGVRWTGTPTFCPQSLAVVQVPGPLMGSWVGQVGKGPVALPRALVGLAAAMRLPEEGQMVLAQDSTSPWGLGLCHDVLKPGRNIHFECLVVLDEAVFK